MPSDTADQWTFQQRCLNENQTYYEENNTKHQYCFIKTLLNFMDAKVSNVAPWRSFFCQEKCKSFESYLCEMNSDTEKDWIENKASGHGWWGSLIEPRGGNECLKIIDWATITDCKGTYYVICEKG